MHQKNIFFERLAGAGFLSLNSDLAPSAKNEKPQSVSLRKDLIVGQSFTRVQAISE